MSFRKHRTNTPLFLWLTVIATTALLATVVVVELRDGSVRGSDVVQFVPTDLEKQYSKTITASIAQYTETVSGFDAQKDAEVWLEEAEVLHDTLLEMVVPQRMQTLHLNAVLQVSQAITALKQENTAFLSTHLSELDTVLAALSYE